MPHDPYKALYIHLPFCKHRCAYCDFATRAVERDSPEVGEYIERLILDIRRKAKEGELSAIETVYLGGGTPSYIGSKHLSNLLYTLGVSMDLTPGVECSMEANPESITPELIGGHLRARREIAFLSACRASTTACSDARPRP